MDMWVFVVIHLPSWLKNKWPFFVLLFEATKGRIGLLYFRILKTNYSEAFGNMLYAFLSKKCP